MAKLEAKTILVYSCDTTLGDAAMKLPFLVSLRQAYPEAKITWCDGKGETFFATSLKTLVVDQLKLLDEVIHDVPLGRSAWEIINPFAPLGGRKFDIVFSTGRVLMPTLCAMRIRHKFFLACCGDFFLSSVKPKTKNQDRNLLQQMMALLSLATGKVESMKWIEPNDKVLEAEALRLLPVGKTYIAFAPGSSLVANATQKRWPIEYFIAVAKNIKDPVFLLGPNEISLYKTLATSLPHAHFPLQQTKVTSPALVLHLAKQCCMGIANDTAIGHLLAAVGTPLVSLYLLQKTIRKWLHPSSVRVICAENFAPAGTEVTMSLIPPQTVNALLKEVLNELHISFALAYLPTEESAII